MHQGALALRPTGDGDGLRYVETLLERNDLPTGDVRDEPGRFYVARADGDRVGVGGVEVHGTDGLLRSVVVERSARGQGIGSALVGSLESRASESGVGTLYLLTTTAAEFFAGLGYDEIERDRVPHAIRETTEFADLCPDSATCMRTSL